MLILHLKNPSLEIKPLFNLKTVSMYYVGQWLTTQKSTNSPNYPSSIRRTGHKYRMLVRFGVLFFFSPREWSLHLIPSGGLCPTRCKWSPSEVLLPGRRIEFPHDAAAVVRPPGPPPSRVSISYVIGASYTVVVNTTSLPGQRARWAEEWTNNLILRSRLVILFTVC